MIMLLCEVQQTFQKDEGNTDNDDSAAHCEYNFFWICCLFTQMKYCPLIVSCLSSKRLNGYATKTGELFVTKLNVSVAAHKLKVKNDY